MRVESAIAELPMLAGLEPAALERVGQEATVTSWPAGAALWDRGHAGDVFTFIISGRVKLLASGEEVRRDSVIRFVGDGELACGAAVSCSVPYCCTAVCTHDSRLMLVPAAALLPRKTEDMDASSVLLRHMANRSLALCQRMRETLGRSADQRLAAALVRLADDAGSVRGHWAQIADPRRDELAALCGMTPETAVRMLTRMAQTGSVVKNARGLRLDLERLGRIAHGLSSVTQELPRV